MTEPLPAAPPPAGMAPAGEGRRRRRLSSPRLWVGLLVTAGWLAVMFTLWRNESTRPGSTLRQMGIAPEVLMVEFGGYSHVMWIQQAGRRLGATWLSIVQEESPVASAAVEAGASPGSTPPAAVQATLPKYDLESLTYLEARMLGLRVPLTLAIRVRMNVAFELETIQAQADALGRRLELSAFTEGERLFYRIRVEGDESATTATTAATALWHLPAANGGELLDGGSALAGEIDLCGSAPLESPVVLSDVILPIVSRRRQLAAGQRWSTRVDHPLFGLYHLNLDVEVEGLETIEFDGGKIEAWRMTERVGPSSSTVWYDQEGQLLRRVMEGGIVMERATAADVRQWRPSFGRMPVFEELDREYIRGHLEPHLTDRSLAGVLPDLPGLR